MESFNTNDSIAAATSAAARAAAAILSSPTQAPPRRPSLLPAFEPFSSSPGLPRSSKRKLDDAFENGIYYPTPVPTSSTGILASSPPARHTRPRLQRTVSMLSERAPLGDVPSLAIHANGDPILLGRSSNSSNYQLPGNRQISRVHVRACYLAPTSSHPAGVVEIECRGWNGVKVHCRGEAVELQKGGLFRSDAGANIMLDVQDTRVMLLWPKALSMDSASPGARSTSAEESPRKRRAVSERHIASSPPQMMSLPPRSPVSPTPAVLLASTFTSTFHADGANDEVKVYEDHDSDADAPHDPTPELEGLMAPPASTFIHSDPIATSRSMLASEQDEFSEHDEENDPIIHSFGPFGENILSRFQSFPQKTPERKGRIPNMPSFSSPIRPTRDVKPKHSPIKNHVINQLAFSRSHSLPLSLIHSNLPAELRGAMAKPSDIESRDILTTCDLKTILDVIPCIGEIAREGKDAHGKLLESEFYYVPEMDADHMRRDAVTQSLGKTSIRAARKQHKQYYWKRPR